ncbi:hypothetical protein MIND_00063700 [Mycena indigotica]|uniref:Uncharacterized protein n=1 Tax=Mycena indigotica TaxID=2126181 RepID=A0A8H6TB19_9AGAR|nr:uncharacterized protein MIND_00063700 [Mycena indigotica]KAF7315485.1 hypothetical protein MIND_00063700 [Mycena indigotica]
MASYRLEAPRARLPPLQVDKPSSYSSSEPLLYNLPVAHSTSPPTSRPTSPRSPKSRLTSPTSPTFARSRTPISARPTPSPTARTRSATPIGVSSSELDQFAEYCRAWYFDQDDSAGRLMTQTLANLPSSQRAPYSRLQASIRSAFHRSVNARKTAEFRATLSATLPGASLTPHARANPNGNVAKKERYERFERFVRTWCSMGMPGPQPFFQSLWAIMRLQIVPETIGGAGQNVIMWEFNDAVFRESAGRDFMLDAIDVLKGVLAFQETSSSRRVSGLPNDYQAPTIHARSQSQPISSISPNVQPKRARAPSDPFLDTPTVTQSLSSSPSSNTSALLSNQTTPEDLMPQLSSNMTDDAEDPIDDVDEEYLRIWTSPDLTNPEFVDLLKVFPAFITRRTLPRFPVTMASKDVEQGLNELEGKTLQFGTGTMWVSSIPRSEGYQGGFWARFILWWKQVFC